DWPDEAVSPNEASALILLLPPARQGGDDALGPWLGEALARTLRRRLEASGRRVLSIDAALEAARAARVALGAPLREGQVEQLRAETGAADLVTGTFCWTEEDLALALTLRRREAEPTDVLADGPRRDFQEVIDDAVVR